MALSIVYNVYYSTASEGPWTLSNETPIAHLDAGNTYSVSGLKIDVIYYFLIIGGYMNNGNFIPLISQAIGPDGTKASGIGPHAKPNIFCKTFGPKIPADSSLGHKFNVTI
jgi:hypothetical protein